VRAAGPANRIGSLAEDGVSKNLPEELFSE
jgi:hypothetical protein